MLDIKDHLCTWLDNDLANVSFISIHKMNTMKKYIIE